MELQRTRRIAVILTLIALTGCASGPQSINDMLRTGQCFAWSTDADPIQVRALDGLAYDARKGGDTPLLTWGDKRSVVAIGHSSMRIADFKEPDQLSFKPLLGASGPVAKLLKGGSVEISKTDVGNIQTSPGCTPADASLAVAGVFYLRTLREGGAY